MVSVWAQGRQQSDATNPPPPDQTSVWASLDPQAQAAQQALAREPRPIVPAALSAPPPQVALAKQPPSPEQEQIGADQAKLSKLEWQDTHPWGTPENHPGKLGKVAHVFSTLGNIAGDIFAPATMANIPGTQLNRQVQEGDLSKRLETETTADSTDQYRGAEAAKDTEETAEMPAKAADTHALAESEIGERGAQTAGDNPDIATYRSLVKLGMSPQEALDEVEKSKSLALKPPNAEHISVLDDSGQPVEANYDPATRQTTTADGKIIKNPRPVPPPAAVGAFNMIVPDPNNPGGGIVQRMTPGAHVAPGAQTPGGVNTENTPTTQMRNTAQRAELVHSMVPEVIADIDKNQQALGPMMGRWNDFMQGKVGTDNPAIAQLRADLLLMSSSVALAHAQGRLPENLREEFDKLINAPQQTPENLKAVINEVDRWMVQNQNIMKGNEGGGQEPTRPANVPEGYQFNANGPKGAGWYAPTAK